MRALSASVIEANTDEQVSDAYVVERALSGDRWAEEVLVRRHFEPVSRLVLRLLGNRQDSEDVVQDTFLAALDDLEKLRDPDALKAWLLQIAVNKVHRRFRKRKLLRRLGLDRSVDDATFERMAHSSTSPEVRAELALVDKRLARLASVDRTAWVLRYVEGHTMAEVARISSCSLATAKRRVSRAHRQVDIQLTKGSTHD